MKYFAIWRRWTALPAGMRRAGILALATTLVATGLLYQTNVRSEQGERFTRGGRDLASAPELGGVDVSDLQTALPESAFGSAAGRSRSKATVRVDGPSEQQRSRDWGDEGEGGGGRGSPGGGGAPSTPGVPATGVYTYELEGFEEAPGFGRRDYPETMTVTVHRDAGNAGPKLGPRDVVVDLAYSPDHEEREILSYGSSGPSLRYEASDITFGPVQRTSESAYDPAVVQIPFPLKVGAKASGSSQVKSAEGEAVGTDDWTSEVLRRERIRVLDRDVDAWVTKAERKSKEGGSQRSDRRREYWFDAERMVWVKWSETFTGSSPLGPGNYRTEFTATLVQIQPLS